MADLLETPVSEAFKGGYTKVVELWETFPDTLYAWLNWIFFKTHFKDRSLQLFQNRKKGKTKIGDLYNWKAFQAILAVARAPLYGNKITKDALGTVRIFRVEDHSSFHAFNYADNGHGSLIFIRLHDCAVVAMLSDARSTEKLLSDILSSVGTSVTAFQMAELLAEFHFAGLRLRAGPRLEHEFDPETGEVILEMEPSGVSRYAAAAKKERDEIFRCNLIPQLKYARVSPSSIRKLFQRVETENFSLIPYLNGLERTFPEQEIAVR
jgi:hypothetical protein